MQDGIELLNGALGVIVVLLAEVLALGVKTFRGNFKMFLINIYNCLKAKILRGALGNNCWVECLRAWWRRDKQPFEARNRRSNLFILVNNIVADWLDYCNGCHILQKMGILSIFC